MDVEQAQREKRERARIRRHEIALAAMQGLLAHEGVTADPETVAVRAVKYAEALMEELDLARSRAVGRSIPAWEAAHERKAQLDREKTVKEFLDAGDADPRPLGGDSEILN